MTETSDLAYDISVCVNRDEIEPESTKLWGQAPVNIRPLRRLDDGSLRSALVSLPAGWRCDTPLKVAAIQQFAILSGRQETVELLDRILAEAGDDPAAWMPEFHRRRKQL